MEKSCLGNKEERACSLGWRQRKRKVQRRKTGKETKGMLGEGGVCVCAHKGERSVCMCVRTQRNTGKQAETQAGAELCRSEAIKSILTCTRALLRICDGIKVMEMLQG